MARVAWNKGLTKETDARVARYAQHFQGERNPQYGKPAWSRGLTKDTDSRLKKAGMKISETKKRQYALGQLTPWNKGKHTGQISWNKGSWNESELDKETLEDLYLNNKLSHRKIAEIIGCSSSTVYKRLQKHGIPIRSIGESLKGSKRPDLSERRKDPAFVSEMMKAMHMRPTKPERKLLALIEEHGFPFRYCGDGDVILGGKNPDFINYDGMKQLIEVYGSYWHRNDDPSERIRFFEGYGYDCLVLWDHELENLDSVTKKIIDKFGLKEAA